MKALFQKEWSAAVTDAQRILGDAKSLAQKPALLVKTIYPAGARITGTYPKRRAFLHQGITWLCDIFKPLCAVHFDLQDREADMLTVVLVSTMPRLQMLFPEAEERNIQFLTEIIEARIQSHEFE